MKEQTKTTVGMASFGNAIGTFLALVLEKLGVELATSDVAILITFVSAVTAFALPHNLYQRIKDRRLFK